jgi:hypothetical protein
MIPARHRKPLRHPYLRGGGISGALVAGVAAAFIAVTALVTNGELPHGTPGISASPVGTPDDRGGVAPRSRFHATTHGPGPRRADHDRGGSLPVRHDRRADGLDDGAAVHAHGGGGQDRGVGGVKRPPSSPR